MNDSKHTSGINNLAGIAFLALAGFTFWEKLQLGIHLRNYEFIMNWQLMVWCLIWFGMGVLIFSGKINARLALLPAVAAGIEALYYTWYRGPYYLCMMGAYAVIAVMVILVIAKNGMLFILWFLPVLLYIGGLWQYGYSFDMMLHIWSRGRNLTVLFELLALFFTPVWLLTRYTSEKKEEDLRFDPEASTSRGKTTSEYSSGSRSMSGTGSTYSSGNASRGTSGYGAASRGTSGYGAASRGMTPEERERQKKTYKSLLDADVITRSEYEAKMKKLNRL